MTVSAPETPTNTIANTVRALAAKGFGHEDIVVRLRAGGLRISDNGRERIKQIVLKRTAPTGRGKPPVGAKPLVKVR